MHRPTKAGHATGRRAVSALVAATLLGALVVPASALASGAAPTPQPDSITVLEDSGTTAFDVVANDTDAELDPLTITAIMNTNGSKYTIATVPAQPGWLSITPAPNYSGGPTTFTYTVSDGTAARSATVTVNVTAVNDAPVAVDLEATIDEDGQYAVTEATMLAGATDADAGDTLAVSGTGNASHGAAVYEAGTATFTPAADYCGSAGFDFMVSDGQGGSDTAHVALTVTCIEDDPVAPDQLVEVFYNTAKAFTLDASDGDGDALVYTVVDGLAGDGSEGALSGTAPDLTYTPPADTAGTFTFTYRVNDGDQDSELATVTIEVADDVTAPVPTAPTVAFGTGRVNESAPLIVAWSAADGSGVGVTGYEVQVKVGGAAWATVSSGTATSLSAFYPFNTPLQWRVRATDANDNTSDWATSATRKLVAYQGASPVAFTGTWTKVKSTGSSGTNYRYTTTAGKKVQVTFTGVGVLYVAPKLSTGGRAKVTIAGATTRVNLRASSTTLGVIVTSRMWSSSGSRTIKVVNAEGGRRTTFDAFIVLQ